MDDTQRITQLESRIAQLEARVAQLEKGTRVYQPLPNSPTIEPWPRPPFEITCGVKNG